MSSPLIVNGLDIATLSDEELFDRLTGLGAVVGPIVSSTRRVYQRKLVKMMGGNIPDSDYNEDVDQEEEEQPIQEEVVQTRQKTHHQSPYLRPAPEKDVRQRIVPPVSEPLHDNVGLEFDPMRHTPSPRRSIRTVTTTTTTTTKEFKHPDEVDSNTPQTSSLSRVLVKFCMFVILLIALLVVYQTYYGEISNIKSDKLLEQMKDAVHKFQSGTDETKLPKASASVKN